MRQWGIIIHAEVFLSVFRFLAQDNRTFLAFLRDIYEMSNRSAAGQILKRALSQDTLLGGLSRRNSGLGTEAFVARVCVHISDATLRSVSLCVPSSICRIVFRCLVLTTMVVITFFVFLLACFWMLA